MSDNFPASTETLRAELQHLYSAKCVEGEFSEVRLWYVY